MPTSVIDWLLEDDAPGVAYLARTQLLGESERSRAVTALRRTANAYPPVARMLDRIGEALAAGDYAKYQGAHWTFIFLADMQADSRDHRIHKLARHILANQLENGGFSTSGKPTYEIVCLTANLLRSLVHFGHGDDPRVLRGYGRLAERILPHGGVPCIALQYSLHTACKMTLPQTLRCLAVAPIGAPLRDMKRLRALLVEQMLGVRVFQYVRPDVKEYYAALEARGEGESEKVIRLRWIADHPVADEDLVPKPGWKRFGFPRSYNPDMLEAMLALAEAGAKHDPAMDDALNHIESKRLRDGRWRMDDSLNGKMLANIEQKGRPSKWITLRALLVLQHFDRLTV